jgi:protein ImuB
VALEAAGPRRVQNGLFAPPVPEPMKLELTLERIRGWVGKENVGVPELRDTHGPEPFALRMGARPEAGKGDGKGWRARPAFRYFRPALKARVKRRGRVIERVEAAGMRGAVVKSAGPWRSSGGWWTEGEWDRQEWDVKLESGTLCRVYQERGWEWFVEGVYD